MQRHSSKNSITSIGSLNRAGEKKSSPTHMIIQREIDNRIVLLPTSHLVNSSVARIKLNDTATFKMALNNRKQERGRILQLGNEEECAEQLQVFEMTADIDPQEKTSDTDHDNDDDDEEQRQQHQQQKQNKVQEALKKSPTPSFNNHHRTNSGSNRNIPHSSNNNKTPDIRKPKENFKSKYLQINEEEENETNSSSEEDLHNLTAKELFDNSTLSKQTVQRYTTNSIGKHQGHLSSKKLSNKEKDHNRFVSQSKISIDVGQSKDSNKHADDDTIVHEDASCNENDLPAPLNFNDTDLMYRYEKLCKLHEEERRKNIALEKENHRLFKEVQTLKTTTIPMPDAAARQWIINTGKSLDLKNSSVNIHAIAEALNITDVTFLLKCVKGTTTSTARQVVKLLYPLSVRQTATGDIVTEQQRELIHTFAVSQRGPVLPYAFREAIDGVFRSTKHDTKKAARCESELTSKKKPNEANQLMDKGQKTLIQMMKPKKRLPLYSNENVLGKENKPDDKEVYEANEQF